MRAPFFLIALFAALLPSIAFGQGAVQQSGPVTPGHAPVWYGSGIVGDAGPASGGNSSTGLNELLRVAPGTGTPPYANSGTGPNGTNDCNYDAPVTNPGGGHFLCFSPNAQGGGLIDYGSFGGAPVLPLNCDVNGQIQPCVGSGGTAATANSVTLLRAGNFSGQATLFLSGYYTPGDAGSGTFALVPGCAGPAGTTLTDNGGTVLIDSAGNCFQRSGTNGAAASVGWFGVKSDLMTVVNDGAITQGTNLFCSMNVTFLPSDIGKVFEYNLGNGLNPWISAIVSVNGTNGQGSCVTLGANAPNTFPTNLVARAATWDNTTPDLPGSGYAFGTTLTVTGGIFTQAAQVTMQDSQLVALTIVTPGTGYTTKDVLTCNGTGGGSKQKEAVTGRPATVNGSGGITSLSEINAGLWKHANPTAITCTGGRGTGATFAVLANNGSFGIADVNLVTAGNYTVEPGPNNDGLMSATSDSGTGSGATIDLTFSQLDWSYGTNDTANLQNAENWAESNLNARGITHSLRFPQGTQTLVTGITINSAMSWQSDGPMQARIVGKLGSGVSIGGSVPAVVAIAAAYPAGDDYQVSGYGQPAVLLSGMTISGQNSSYLYDSGHSTGLASSQGCIALANPVSRQGQVVPVVLNNVFAYKCPNHIVSTASGWNGSLRGSQMLFANSNENQTSFTATSVGATQILSAISPGDINAITRMQTNSPVVYVDGPGIPDGTTLVSIDPVGDTITLSNFTNAESGEIYIAYGGGDCLHFDNAFQPIRLYALITHNCVNGASIDRSSNYEIHGWTSFQTVTSLAVTGSPRNTEKSIDIFGAQFTTTFGTGVYLDQTNQVVNCFGCIFRGGNGSNSNPTSPVDSEILLGSDAGSGGAIPFTSLIATSSQTDSDLTDNTIFFRQSGTNYCTCNIVFTAGVDVSGSVTVPVINPTSLSYLVSDYNPLFGFSNGLTVSGGPVADGISTLLVNGTTNSTTTTVDNPVNFDPDVACTQCNLMGGLRVAPQIDGSDPNLIAENAITGTIVIASTYAGPSNLGNIAIFNPSFITNNAAGTTYSGFQEYGSTGWQCGQLTLIMTTCQGIQIAPFSGQAGAGGTLQNYSANFELPQGQANGSGATELNIALRLHGNVIGAINGTNTNYLIRGLSNAPSLFDGEITANQLAVLGNVSLASPGFGGFVFSGTAATLTDTTGTSITTQAAASLPVYTFDTTNTGATINNAVELYLPAPLCVGADVTCSGFFSLFTQGNIKTNGSLNVQQGLVVLGANSSINANSNFNTSLNTGTSTGLVTVGNSLDTFNIAAGVLQVSGTAAVSCSGALTGSAVVTNGIVTHC